MRKILFIIAALLTFQLSADPNSDEIKKDQIQALMGFNSTSYHNIMTFCKEKGYKFFKITNMQYEDKFGLKMQVSGVAVDKTGDIFKSSDVQALSDPNGSLEIICYKNDPKDVTCSDVDNFFQMIKLFQDQYVEQVNETSKENENTTSQVIEITSLEELKNQIATSNGPVFVDCYGNSCPPCKILAPFYEKVSNENSENAKFLKVNIEIAQDVAEVYQIKAVPTLLMFEKDELQAKWIGLPEIIKFLNNLNAEEIAKNSN
ncbi:MAG: Thioredoxin C-2 [Candidatus Anoxychlamydiales bacterium]|nr:Thioredoxin C-2 [Candidatus Anoxychlamydiales bacterium]